jgi:hypothetical protein
MDMDFEQPVAVDPPNLTWPHRVVGLGVASLILLVLCLLFAHHWNVVTLTLVTAWAVCVLGARRPARLRTAAGRSDGR